MMQTTKGPAEPKRKAKPEGGKVLSSKTKAQTDEAMRQASETPVGTWHSGQPGDPSLKSG